MQCNGVVSCGTCGVVWCDVMWYNIQCIDAENSIHPEYNVLWSFILIVKHNNNNEANNIGSQYNIYATITMEFSN